MYVCLGLAFSVFFVLVWPFVIMFLARVVLGLISSVLVKGFLLRKMCQVGRETSTQSVSPSVIPLYLKHFVTVPCEISHTFCRWPGCLYGTVP